LGRSARRVRGEFSKFLLVKLDGGGGARRTVIPDTELEKRSNIMISKSMEDHVTKKKMN